MHESIGAFPSIILAAGSYTAVATHQDQHLFARLHRRGGRRPRYRGAAVRPGPGRRGTWQPAARSPARRWSLERVSAARRSGGVASATSARIASSEDRRLLLLRRRAGGSRRSPPPPRGGPRPACSGTFATRMLAHLVVDLLVAQVALARRPAACSRSSTVSAYSSASEVMVATTTCTGASQSGSLPAESSIRMPMKRSNEPRIARCSITGACRAPSSPT